MWQTVILSILIAAVSAVAIAQSGAATCTYHVEAPGYVSAVVRDASGKVARTAFVRQQHEAGDHTFFWDGFDDDGRQLTNGTYQFHAVWTPGFVSTYRAMAGTSLGLAQVPGNHSPIESLAIGNSPYLLIASRGDNTSPFESCLSKDGTARLGEGQRFTGGRVAATTGATTDVPDEFDVWYDVSVSEWGEAGVLRKNQLRVLERGGIYKCEWNIKLPGQTAADWVDHRYGIDALGDIVVVCYQSESLVRFFDCTRRPSEPGDILPAVVLNGFSGITHPVDVALENATTALVTTATTVSRYNRSSGLLTAVVAGLTDASSIDVNRTSGEFYVVVRGGTQVLHYSAAGILQDSHGRSGGRQSGPYDPQDFGKIWDVASDQAGNFWVSDEFPRRVSFFRNDGSHVRDLFGPQGFYNASVIDPADPDRLWMESPGPGLPDLAQPSMSFLDGTLDRDTWKWSVSAVRIVPRAVGGDFRERWRCHVIDGRRYFSLGTGYTGSLVVREAADGELVLSNVLFAALPWWSETGLNDLEKAHRESNQSFVYTNSQPVNSLRAEDYQWSPTGGAGWEGFFDDELNFYHWFRYGDNRLYQLARTGWNAVGAPTYRDFSQHRLVVDPAQAGFPGNIQVHRWLKLSDGGFAALIQDEDRPHFGQDWPDSLNGGWWIAKFHADGTLAWKTGTKNLLNLLSETPTRTGTLCEPAQFCGEINGCIVVADRIGSPAIAYTLDGVCVGQFLDGRANDGLPSSVYEWWDRKSWPSPRLRDNPRLLDQQTPFQYDMLKGGSVHPGETPDDVLWLPHGRNNTPVFSVAGWAGWVTKNAPLVLNRADVVFDGNGLTAKYYNSADWTGTVTTRIDPDLRMWYMRARGAFASGVRYNVGDVVSSAGAYYFCLQTTNAVPVTNADYWYKLDPRFVNPADNGWYRPVNAPGVASYDRFSVTWSGQIVPFHTGTHWFAWEGDAAEVWINGSKVIDHSSHYGQVMSAYWADCRQKFFHTVSAPIELVSGQPVPIEIKLRVSSPITNWPRGNDLFQERFSPRAALFWATEGFSARLVDSKYLYPTTPAGSASGETATASLSSGGVALSWETSSSGETFQIWRGTDRDPYNSALIATNASGHFVDAFPPPAATTTYWVRSTTGTIIATSNTVATPGAANATSAIQNLSTRAAVDDSHPLIMGFVLGGNAPHELLIRAVGPGLAPYGVTNHIAAPQIRLHRMENSDATLLSAVAAWGLQPNAVDIAAAFDRTGAFPLQAGSEDAAFLQALLPSMYTAVVTDVSHRQGVGLVELYLADSNASVATTHFRNLSARGHATEGAGALIGGFVLNGTAPKRFLLRGIGPTLSGLGISAPLPHPVLRLFAQNQQQPLIENASWWMADGGIVQMIRKAETATGAFALADGTDDTAVLVELSPGAYTVHLLPAPGTSAGDALIEIFPISP